MHTPEPSTNGRSTSRRRALAGKLAAVGLTGLLVGSAVAVGSMASADEPTTTDEPAPAEVEPADETADRTVDSGWAIAAEAIESTPEDEAVWQRFDDCLTENGVPLPDEADLAEAGEEAPEPVAIEIDDAAIEACEDILDDLSGDGFIELGEGAPEPAPLELSPEDEAVFERYDDCLVENGVPSFDDTGDAELDAMTDEDWEAFDDAWEAAAEACDPILADLSDDLLVDGDVMIDEIELSPEDEAVFERYDECLAENGVPMLDDAEGEDVTDAEIEAFEEAYEAAAEACDPILEGLSEDVFFGGIAVEGCDLDEAETAPEVAPTDS